MHGKRGALSAFSFSDFAKRAKDTDKVSTGQFFKVLAMLHCHSCGPEAVVVL